MPARDRQRTEPVPPQLRRFAELVSAPAPELRLAEASLEIGRDEYPDLDVPAYLARIERLRGAAERLDPGSDAPVRERLAALNRVLFQEEGFHGPGHDHSSDPRSSYLNEVLDRRTGLPIILSVLYLEVGRNLGLDLVGVGMPAHFIVRLRGAEPALFIDPYHAGEFLDEDGCRKLLSRVTSGRIDLQPEYLAPLSSTRILDRILQNLKVVYVQQSEFRRARRVVNQILVMHPGSPDQIRDRGMLAYQGLLFAEALQDLERYIELAPRAEDASAIRSHVQTLRRLVPCWN